MTNSDARKRHDEAHAPAGEPRSPEASPSATDATNGQEGGNRAEEIEAIRARVEAATPGPWHFRAADAIFNPSVVVIEDPDEPVDAHEWVAECGPHQCNGPANAEFIAHARTDIPLLLAALDRVTAERNEAIADLEAGDACGAVGCRAMAERDSLAAALASVRELADALDAWDGDPTSPFASSPHQRDQLRAALTVTTTEEP